AKIINLVAGAVANRFQLGATKGRVAVGADADLVLVNLNEKIILQPKDLFYRHQLSPYIGRTCYGRIVRTLVRGTTIFYDGQIVGLPSGRLLTPGITKREGDR